MSTETDPLDEAQWAQVRIAESLEAEGVAIGGWKLGMTSGDSRDALGAGFRPFGFVRSDRIYHDGDSLSWAEVTPGQIETELCILVQEDLTGEVTAEVARRRVQLAAGFELNQKRLPPGAEAPDRIADNLSQWGIVAGSPVPVPEPWAQEEMLVRILRDGAVVSEVSARNHIDDHLVTIARLANRLQQFGRRLRKGDLVITGAFGKVAEPEPGAYTGSFSGVGDVTINVTR